ncbi:MULTISPECIES: ABC transporter permease [Schaedlerella]|jgi:oligopeptide transport system permease protein|uniref:ABC transporter permease n=1 Tax=Schaedlerella arabinosiphila TaxID=2044587 RepID=N2B7T1_9FIRM|nr:ABC transporter permease [Schaedlerella arabinosiphila]MCI8767649.1 ABC transporter permease [Ruminococcus sp.]KAI4439281.1 Oligopeptide transport system permease protein OppB [Schaedlerella arabinosiphila]MCI9634500.1 ABC transporter permease [Ruminococcus sp.]MDE7066084.1 ABC transporter permease [Schaedlerella arabinosiphila]NDO67660.1 ABC transporter permease [Schaedlerella arabinosiphila]
MLKYIAKRIGLAIVTIWAVATITFFLMNMVPGGPFLSEKAISPQATAALEAKYGLDKPLFQQYLTYIGDALHGDLGDSLKQRGRTVMDIISTKFPVSARVGGISVLVALTLGIPLGCIAALKRGKFLDSLISVVATCGIAVPSFVICTVLLYFFGVKLGVLPTLGIGTWKHYIMPVMALSFYPTAYIMRLMRSSMLDVLGQDYMRTAKAKGVSGFVSLFKHALRNAILPVVTYVGPMLAYTVTGSFVVEKIFTIPGLGGEFIRAINGRDYTLIMGTTIFLATLIIVMNVAVDIVYKIVDPRIKLK